MDDSFSFESFFEGAKKAAYKAMDDHARGEYDEFALHAGVAIERLAKAVLYRLNPLYIASGKVHLGGQKARIYTITAMEALSRLSSLNILKVDADLKLLIEQRNGTVHASVGDEAKAHIPTLAKTVGPMLKHLDVSEYDFWGRWTSAVTVAVDKERDEIQRDVEIRIKQARHLFEDRFEGLPEGAKEKILAEPHPGEGVVLGPLTVKNNDKILFLIGSVPCPACGGKASMTLTPVAQSDSRVDMTPDSFQCPLCGLELNNPLEITAARVETETGLLPTGMTIKQVKAPFPIQWGETHAG
ncbi:hypothetical protein [Streptomyces sp. NPDC003299]